MSNQKTEIQVINFYDNSQFDIQVVITGENGEIVSDEYMNTYDTLSEAKKEAKKIKQELPHAVIVEVQGVE